MNMTKPHNLKSSSLALLALVMTLTFMGCTNQYTDIDAFVVDPKKLASDEPYTVAPPDVLKIIAPQVQEIHNSQVTVSPDGTIFLPLIGELVVSGHTPVEIAALIEDRALEYYQECDVAVQVTRYMSKHVYVFGQVAIPGRYNYTGSDTVMDILSRAQPTNLAEKKSIHVYRPGKDGKPVKRLTVNFKKWLEEGSQEYNAQLEESDIIYVPPTGLASVGLALQQLLLPVQPAAQTVRGTANMDSDVSSIKSSE